MGNHPPAVEHEIDMTEALTEAPQVDVPSAEETPSEAPTEEKSLPRKFAHLHVHSHFSLLDGASKVDDMVAIAKANNMPAMAITDHGVMYGAIEFYNKAKAAGIKPIIGCDLYLIDGDITERGTKQVFYEVVLLCKNLEGYRNLTKIVSTAQMEGFYYKPRCNWALLEKYSEGLICLTGTIAGPLAKEVLRGNPQLARDHATRLKKIYGDDLYVELFDHGKEAEYRYSVEAVKIANELGLETVITNDTHFSRPDDHHMQQILMCLQTGRTLEDTSRPDPYGPQYYIKNGDEMAELLHHLDKTLVEQSLNNTLAIAEKVDLDIPQGISILPDYPLPDGVGPDEALKDLVQQKALEKFGSISEEQQKRIDYELGIIGQMGFPAYFLITADFIAFARQKDIPVGPGRGSAAGSLVAFILEITDIDPLEHNLLFERFLNPERVSMPDIDIDFCIEKREQVIEYVTQKYGRECVSQIITFGTLAARAALKAVARVLDVPFAESDRLAKMIPAMPGTKLIDAVGDKTELGMEAKNNPQVKELVDLALKIEGTACNVGVHAAGVVISKDPLTEVVPVQLSKEGGVVSAYPMGDLEKLGLLKMDFLGLRNLTIIENTVKLVEQNTGDKVNMRHLPLDDKKVYTMLTEGETDGIFQLESAGMRALVKDLKPSVFEDVGALVALYRPGPLNSGMVKQFVDRKHGRAEVSYQHPALEPILKDTYGTIVYQEQIMQIAQSLAGYSLGQADLLRRAMGKKKAEVMEKERAGFLAGCEQNNVDTKLATELFDTMSEFAAYCFNRSHSAAYALVAYQTAYLKAHYPVDYLSALLSSVRNDMDKIQYYILAARKMNIEILPPNVNSSGVEFTPDDERIRFGLASIKNVGVGVVEDILAAREKGTFKTLEDFLERVNPRVLNRKTLESLILAGAMGDFGITRQQLFNNVETLVNFASRSFEEKETGQVNLFKALGAESEEGGFSGLSLAGSAEEFDDDHLQKSEKELLGFYVSSHPLDKLQEKLPLMINQEILGLKSLKDGTEVRIGGLVSKIQKRLTRKNTPMWIGQLEDLTGSIEFVMFSESIEKYGHVVEDGSKAILTGTLQFRGDSNENASVIIREAMPIKDIKLMNIFFEAIPSYQDVAHLGKLLAQHRGNNPVIVNFGDGTRIKTGHGFWVDEDDWADLTQEITNYFGSDLKVG